MQIPIPRLPSTEGRLSYTRNKCTARGGTLADAGPLQPLMARGGCGQDEASGAVPLDTPSPTPVHAGFGPSHQCLSLTRGGVTSRPQESLPQRFLPGFQV